MFIILGSICQDYPLASMLSLIRKGLNVIQIVAPIILIIVATFQFVKLTINPDDDKKSMKKIYNSFMSAIIIFFIPMIINLSMNIINEYGDVGIIEGEQTKSFDIASCWQEAKQTQNIMDSVRENGGSKSSTIAKEHSKKKSTLGSNPFPENSSGSSSNNNNYSSSSNNSTKGAAVITYAKRFIGNPYKWGGEDLNNGADCSGFIKAIYKNFGVDLPHSSSALENVGTKVEGLENARAGDIICYGDHVALFLGEGKKIIHAQSQKTGIVLSNNAIYGKRTIRTIRRIFND